MMMSGAQTILVISSACSRHNAITDGKRSWRSIFEFGQADARRRAGENVETRGSFITLREVVDEVGKDAVRFMMLTRKSDAPLDFDFDFVKDKSRDNRFSIAICSCAHFSVMKNARELGWQVDDADLAGASFDALTHEAELGLIHSALIRACWRRRHKREPHRVAFI